jgi:membrane-associated phospholipid phosphatase
VNEKTQRERGLAWRALLCLALSGAVFFGVYISCNRFTATRSDVGTCYFGWEKNLPFIPWLVLPYWSLDLFFCGSFFLCATRTELHRHTLRLIVVTLLSGVCFLLIPMRFGWARPEPSGWTAPLFRALYTNDLPYNLAPSLHISLRSLVWIVYGAHLRGRLRQLTKIWFILIGLSTLLLWQHHLMDVASGFLMGWFIQALIPNRHFPRGRVTPAHRRLALRYGAGALICALLALPGGGWWWFAWPAVALAIPTLAYLRADPAVMGKENGTLSPAAEWCLLPVMLVSGFIHRHYRRRLPPPVEIMSGIHFGRRLSKSEARALLAAGPVAVLDLTAESNASPLFREHAAYHSLPLLDLIPPDPATRESALDFIRLHHGHRPVFIHCQLGLLRSASIAAAWLVESGTATDEADAFRRILSLQPGAILSASTHRPEFK